MSSVIALLATAGAAIGLALQGSLANFAGGLMLLIFRPFKVGDFIVAGEYKGTVQSISLVYTTLLTFDNATVLIPNGTLMNSNILNATAEPLRRVDLSFDISSAEPSDKVRATVMEAITKRADVLGDPAPAVVASGVVPAGITYAVRVWVNTADYWPVYEGLTEEIPAALNKAGIERPSMPVHIDAH
jgi:small conductance mechanosensitive channel